MECRSAGAGTLGSVLSVKELRALGASLPAETFQRQLGPFTLIQRPPAAAFNSVLEATSVAMPVDIERGMLSLLFEFEDLQVATLPPLKKTDALTIGRLPDCDVVVDSLTVSRQHAVLRWSEEARHCTVRDLGSTSGTFLNASSIGSREVPLRDGDILSFGNVQFWYLLTDSLYARLRSEQYARIRSHSG
jgi:hypothetical protein